MRALINHLSLIIMSKHKHIIKFIFAIGIISLSIYFQNQLSELKSLGLLGIFLANFLGNATFLVTTSNNLHYEPFLIGLVTSVGGSLGQMVGFELGSAGKNLFIKNHHIIFVVTRGLFRDYGKFIVFFMAFLPDQFFGVVSLLAGISNFSPLRFFVILFIGRLVRNLILVSLGLIF